MSDAATRIRWLAEFSAERRTARNATIRYAAEKSIEFIPTISESKVVARRLKGAALKAKTDQLVNVQKSRCYICIAAGLSDSLSRFGDGDLRPTLDHVWPIAEGGTNRMNLAAAHSGCNNRKANRIPTKAEMDCLAQINAGHSPETMSGYIPSTTIGSGCLCLTVTTASRQSVEGNPTGS